MEKRRKLTTTLPTQTFKELSHLQILIKEGEVVPKNEVIIQAVRRLYEEIKNND